MTANIAFPMYDVSPAATDALATAMLSRFPQAQFLRPLERLPHWRDRTLLLSQTCGYPLMTQLPEVQVVGQFHYTAPGCESGNYRSRLVVREADKHKTLAALRDALSEMAKEKEIAEPLFIGGFTAASRRDDEMILTTSSSA